jgi:hypothetical protein
LCTYIAQSELYELQLRSNTCHTLALIVTQHKANHKILGYNCFFGDAAPASKDPNR